MPPWSRYVVKTPRVGLHNSSSPTVPIILPISPILTLLGPRHTSANHSRELLLTNAEEHANGHVQNGKEGNGEASEEPELDTDVLLLAHVTTPVSDTATLGLGNLAVAGEARVLALAVFIQALSMACAVASSFHTAILRGEAYSFNGVRRLRGCGRGFGR